MTNLGDIITETIYLPTYLPSPSSKRSVVTREVGRSRQETQGKERRWSGGRDAPVPVPDWVTGYQSDWSPSRTG